MFTWLNIQGVKSHKGFIVQRTERFTSEYREGDKKITTNLDTGKLPNGQYCEIIDSSTFSKWDDGTLIAHKKQQETFALTSC